MTEAEWLACSDPSTMVEFLRGRTSERKLRLFAVACCRTAWALLPGETFQRAIQLCESAAEGQANPAEMNNLLLEIGPEVNRRYGVFLCGGSDGPGSIFAEMSAAAVLSNDLTFTWTMGEIPTESHTAWRCVAMAHAQTAKEKARELRWDEWSKLPDNEDDEPDDDWYEETSTAVYAAWDNGISRAQRAQCTLLRDISANPFRPVALDSTWLSANDGDIPKLARSIYESRELPSGHLDAAQLAILADALEEAGCRDEQILGHCRGPGPHVRGCWVVDLLLGKE